MHPDLYLRGVLPSKVDLPDLTGPLGKKWKQLDENVLGEFGLQELLKQFLDLPRAIRLAAMWAGDRYALYEQVDTGKDASKDPGKDTNKLLLAFRIHTASDADAAQLFAGLNELSRRNIRIAQIRPPAPASFRLIRIPAGCFCGAMRQIA